MFRICLIIKQNGSNWKGMVSSFAKERNERLVQNTVEPPVHDGRHGYSTPEEALVVLRPAKKNFIR